MADMGLTEVTATIEARIANEIQTQLIETSKLIPTVMNKAAEMGINQVSFPRGGDFAVDDKVENVAVTQQIITYAVDTLLLDKYKTIQVRLEDCADWQSKPDVVSDIIGRMGRQLALQVDTDIVACLEATSAAAPDHRVAYADATSFKRADVLEARRLLHLQNIPFNEAFIGVHPDQEVSLLAVEDFIHADKYGSAEGLRNGELGRLYGAPVIMSTEFDTAKTLVWHPSHAAFAWQVQPKFETDRDLPNLATIYSIQQKYGCTTLDSGKRGVLVGTAV